MNVLFVCSRNKWRSRTAEDVYKKNGTFICKSAGTAPSARIKINAKMITWADVIFVMENKHRQQLADKFGAEMKGKKLHVLHIEDNYTYMDSELIDRLTSGIDHYLNNL